MFDIQSLRRKVLTLYPYFGSVASSLEYKKSTKVKTVSNDGKTLYYNPERLAEAPPKDQLFFLAREYTHVALHHYERGKGKNSEVWKMATESIVNQYLKRDGMDLIDFAIDYPEAADFDAEKYYEILLQNKLAIELVEGMMAKPEGSSNSGNGDGSEGKLSTRDKDESTEDQAEDNSTDENESNDHSSEMSDELFRQLADNESFDEEMFEYEEDDNPDDDSSSDDEEEYTLQYRKAAKAGNSVNPDLRKINRIGTAKPLIDWRLLLRDTVNYGLDWSYKNAIIDDCIIRPILEEVPMPETEILLDTSWSVDDDLLRNFLRECKNILQISKLKVGCFDTVFYGFHHIRTLNDIENIPFEGGGGTDFDVAVEAFTLRVDNRIIFTDGEAPLPETPLNAIWIVYGENKITPPGGTVIYIDPEWLKDDN
ncbi:MAG: VWA-like domain-containing protein [Bacillota bacterium]|nr:VWA-like domain-containing protein [Bacillota bacterium]